MQAIRGLGSLRDKRRPGWMIVASKEFSDHVLSVRFTILVILMGLVAVLVVSTAASGIRTAIEQSSDVPALFLMLFWVPHPRFSFSFLAVMALMGPLLGIAFGFDAVNQERTQGTLPRLVSQPIYRDDVINGKFVAGISAIGVVLVCVTVIVAGVGFLRIGVTPNLTEILRTVLWLVISLAYVGFWLALSMLLSVVLRRGATSALAAIAVWLTLAIFGPLIVGVIGEVIAPVPDSPTFQEQVRNARITQNVSRVLPVSLYGEATIALLRPDVRTFDPLSSLLLQAPETRAVQGALTLEQSVLLVWPQLTALIALTVLCFMGAYISFMRQEVRA